jgi:propanol-preferring alcohol dehydrogenase
MRAMLLDSPGQPLRAAETEVPQPGLGQLLLRVRACGVCRTDLHLVDGELSDPKLPIVPGHEVVGTVAAIGEGVVDIARGARMGVPWLGWTCGECKYCLAGQENLCDRARFTGYLLDGGYAEYIVADHRFCFPIPDRYSDIEAAPLLCAGLIGYRSLKLASAPLVGQASGLTSTKLGYYGFGAAAHIVTQVAVHQGREVYAFTKPSDAAGQQFARQLGCVWAGGSDEKPPVELDAATIFAPVGSLVPAALRAVRKGGVVVCAGIHMSDIPAFTYGILWGERIVRSVANLTRQDGVEFMQLAATMPLKISAQPYPLAQANAALSDLRDGKVHGAAVLTMN